MPDKDLPKVTLLVAAYNEEPYIGDKTSSSSNLDYPKDKLPIFVVTDGSTDNAPDIVKKFHAVKLFHNFQKKGKMHSTVMSLSAHVGLIVYLHGNRGLYKKGRRGFMSPQSIKS